MTEGKDKEKKLHKYRDIDRKEAKTRKFGKEYKEQSHKDKGGKGE